MDLFVVNRFLGDTVEEVSKEDEKKNLNKFLLKIEERRKQRELLEKQKSVNINIIEPGEQTPIDKVIRTVKEKIGKKKRKRPIQDDSDEEEKSNSKIAQISIEKDTGFTILGTDHFKKKEKVKRVLPQWLSKPSLVSVNLQHLTTTVDDIPGIDKELIKTLKENGISHFFPVQCEVIPWLLSDIDRPSQYWPRDVCVSAPTGCGKTLTYVIPIIQAIKTRVVPQIRALVVLPVQDLAIQVAKVFETYCVGTSLKVGLITGRNSFIEEQHQLIKMSIASGPQSLVDIVVTTTGRIVDHLKSTPGFTLSHLRYLVIDEADRIMENIKNDWLYHLSKHIKVGQHILTVKTLETQPRPPQKLLFSATLSQDPEKLQQLGLFQPKLFSSLAKDSKMVAHSNDTDDFVGKYTTPAELSEKMCEVTLNDKPLILYYFLAIDKIKNVLCFTDSQVQAHRLAVLLKHLAGGQFKVAEVSAALNRKSREDILTKFAEGNIDIVICTDSYARGMDIPIVDNVISYNPPKFIENYIHRIGRTARAGKNGTAITFVQSKQKQSFRDMLKISGKSSIEDLVVVDLDINSHRGHFRKAMEAMQQTLQNEESRALEKSKSKKRSRKPTPRNKKRKLQSIDKT